MKKDVDYLQVLKALYEIPFPLGRKLLTDFLQGDESNDTILKHSLHKKSSFGSLAYDAEEIEGFIEQMIFHGMIAQNQGSFNRFCKVLELTQKGREEITNPALYKKSIFKGHKSAEITESDKAMFSAFGDYLSIYNNEQKKAIISPKKTILCIAGAGSGKTTVLTKRIDFLIRFKSVEAKKILAITFTRKARKEMQERLSDYAGLVQIETFNSFCEKTLKKYNDMIYNRPVRVVSFRDKMLMINTAVSRTGSSMERALSTYFTKAQMRSKSKEQLMTIFMHDCFFVRDYFKEKNRPLDKSFFLDGNFEHEQSAELVFKVCKFIDEYMENRGFRDFSDQLIDAVHFFERHPEHMPKFSHILVDEYQDINPIQSKLINILSPDNLFCVGDPRQSIFGWRGSDISFILNFNETIPESEIIVLKKNYRSSKHIVKLFNEAVRKMQLPGLEPTINSEKDVRLLEFDNELAEFEFVIQCINSNNTKRNEIFVLARTNRQLNDLAGMFQSRGIPHIVRSDEKKKIVDSKDGHVTLATVHAIKGLEAEMVFVIGANSQNFPCKGSEHPVIDLIKVEEYDKEEEERRLFYVAISRAKKSLYITYSGKNHTRFITKRMKEILTGNKTLQTENHKTSNTQSNYNSIKNTHSTIKLSGKGNNLLSRLKDWRKNLSAELGIPAFMILHDSALLDIIDKMPITQRDLLSVKGLGPTKISKWGQDILELVQG